MLSLPQLQRREYYLNLFHGRCVHCGRAGTDIHEIESRGHIGVQALMVDENGVLLCRWCHNWAHEIGTSVSGPVLASERLEFLRRYADTRTNTNTAGSGCGTGCD